ncbi:Glutamate receptor ionotropic, kainate 2, partial [Folsomia candida]
YVMVPEVGPYNFSLAEVGDGVDIFLGSYSLYYERAKLIDPTFVIGNSKIIAVINHEHESNIDDVFSIPFSRWLWIGISIVCLLYFCILQIIAAIAKLSWRDTLFHTASILLQKACPLISRSCTRIAFFSISISLIVLMACYTGNMFSIKTVNRFSINSVQNLLDSDYKILLEMGETSSSIFVMLKALLHIPAIAKLLGRIQSANYVYTTFEDAIKEVVESPTAYVIDEETAVTTVVDMLGQVPCSFSALSIFNLKYPWSMFMRKRSRFKDTINYGLLKLDETGVRRRLRAKWIPHASPCKVSSMPFTSIKLGQVYTALGIYGVGVLTSSVGFFLFEFNFGLRRLRMMLLP